MKYNIHPKISVIIPAYNAEKFITRAIDSILAQQCDHGLEILVIDDNSTDNTSDIVYDLSNRHRQISLLNNKRKKGPSGARNTGLLESKGSYISFLDADDVWYPNHLDEGIRFLEKNENIDAVFYNFDIYEHEDMKKLNDWFSLRSFTKNLKIKILDDEYYLILDNLHDALLDESFIHLQSMIIKSRVINNILFNENISTSEDRDFAIQLHVTSKAQFAYKNIITGVYYRHKDSLTSESMQYQEFRLHNRIHLFKEYLQSESKNSKRALKIKKKLFDSHLSLSYLQRKLNKHRDASISLRKSLSYGTGKSQLRELAKIAVSFLLYTIQQTKSSVK